MQKSDKTDLICGVALVGVAAVFGTISWQDLPMGSATRMGPGYFPMLLAGLLAALGLVILIRALYAPEPRAQEAAPAWRGMLFILPAPVFFGLTVRGLGFVPALFLTALLASFASERMKVWQALLLASLVTLISTLIFSYGLGLPFRRFGPWLPFI